MRTLPEKAFLSLTLLAIWLMLSGCSAIFSAPSRSDDLVGVWIADYSRYHIVDTTSSEFMDFTEKITLKSDYTFQQFVDDKEVATGAWHYDPSTHTVFLDGAMILNEGKLDAELFASHKMKGMFIGCDGKLIEVDGSQLILCATRDPHFKVILQHLGVGDPDAPLIITFTREEE